MAFWGVEVKPGKPYTHRFEKSRGRLHISQATLGIGSSTKRSLVQCNVGNKSPVLLCSLLPDKTESCPLDLEFEEVDEVIFSVIGPQSVHLTGFYLGNERGVCGHDEDSDSYGEDIAETETEGSTDYDDTEDEYEDDFIDDGVIEMFPSSPAPNSGVVIEEILDDEKPANGNNNRKRLKKKYHLSESDDDGSQRKIVVRDGTSNVPGLESEDEDGFPIFSENKPSETNTEVEAGEEAAKKTAKEGKKKKKAKDDGNSVTGLKRKVDTVVQDDRPERGTDQVDNSLMPSIKIGLENAERPKKKKKDRIKESKAKDGSNDKNDIPEEDKTQKEGAKNDNVDQNAVFEKELDPKPTHDDNVDTDAEPVNRNHSEEKKKRKRKKKKNKTQEAESGDANMKESNLATEGKNDSIVEIEDKKDKPSQARTFANGLVIEELSMGKPDGKRASPGNKVSVHYIGKLKKNGQIFDSNIGSAPFKFRLGVGEVIKGWDVGVNGMRIGDKRRLTIPPSMGYGSKGAGGKIPPNSWLMFDVELVDVR